MNPSYAQFMDRLDTLLHDGWGFSICHHDDEYIVELSQGSILKGATAMGPLRVSGVHAERMAAIWEAVEKAEKKRTQ